jgi:hypothetical protein
MSVALPETDTPSRLDDGLAEVVEHLTCRLKAGDAVDLDACLAAHPEHAAELRRVLPALRLLADLSPSSGPVLSGPPPAVPEAAQVLGQLGDFRLIREVGRGGMGVVYEAEQISLNRRVALKVLPFVAALDGRQVQRCEYEPWGLAQAAATPGGSDRRSPGDGVGCRRRHNRALGVRLCRVSCAHATRLPARACNRPKQLAH